MLTWYKHLYTGPFIAKRLKLTKGKLNLGIYPPHVWLISLASNEKDNLDIFPALELKIRSFRKSRPMIVGIAFGYKEALQLLVLMTEDCRRECGNAKLRQWFLEKQEE